MTLVNWDYRLDPPPEPVLDERADYEEWLDSLGIGCFLMPDDLDFVLPPSAEAWADLYRRDLEEPDGWEQDWRDLC